MKTMLIVMALIYSRPPVPPVPFVYDPNMVDCEILKTFEAVPDNHRVILPMKAYDEDGDDVVLTCANPDIWIPPKTDTDLTDKIGYRKTVVLNDPNNPNDDAALHEWFCDIRVGYVETVKYYKFKATDIPADPNDTPKSDNRMVIGWIRPEPEITNHQPVLDIGPIEHIP